MDTEQANLSLERVLGVLRRRAPVILLCVLLAAGATYGIAKSQPKKYTATASLAFSYNSLSQQIAGLSTSSSSAVLAQQASNLELVKLSNLSAKTARLLGHGLTPEQVAASLSIAGRGESAIVDVSATVTSPALAADIANTYTRQFVGEQQTANGAYFKSALALVRKQLARLSPAERFGADGVELQNRAQTLGLLAELGYNNVQVADEALAPSSPSSPKTKKDTILGVVLGLLIGVGVAFLLERLDRRVREPEELERIYQLPMLGVVPKSTALSRPVQHDGRTVSALPPAEEEAFSLIRAHLRFFNVDRDVRTLVIASPAPGDGKSTIARHLAEVAARLGSRVLLLEVDLRRPTLAQQLEIQSGPGLAGVLIGAISMDAAIQSITLEGPSDDRFARHTLDVLVAGALLPPNPGELLESSAMNAVLARSRSTYDLVVIDTPPLTAVSDAFPLLTKVDGVVIVGWIGRSQRGTAKQLQQVVSGSGASLLGVIANGAKPSGTGYYSSPKSDDLPVAVTADNDSSLSEEFAPTADASRQAGAAAGFNDPSSQKL